MIAQWPCEQSVDSWVQIPPEAAHFFSEKRQYIFYIHRMLRIDRPTTKKLPAVQKKAVSSSREAGDGCTLGEGGDSSNNSESGEVGDVGEGGEGENDESLQLTQHTRYESIRKTLALYTHMYVVAVYQSWLMMCYCSSCVY